MNFKTAYQIMKMRNKGAGNINTLIGALIFCLIAGGIAGSMISSFNSSNLGANAPSYASGTLIAVVVAGLIWMVWRAFSHK